MAQEHLGQRQAVHDFGKSHLGFIDAYLYTQFVAACCQAGFGHLLDIVVKFLDQIQIGLGQALLVTQRYHLPVHVVDVVERGLTAGFKGVCGQFLLNVGNAVQRLDGSTHVEGLCQRDGTGKGIVVIRLECIAERLPQVVDRSLGSADVGGGHLRQFLYFGRIQGQLGHLILNGRGKHFAQVVKQCFLILVEKRNPAAGVLICSEGTHPRQVLRPCRLALILSNTLLNPRHLHLLVVLQSHGTALIEC